MIVAGPRKGGKRKNLTSKMCQKVGRYKIPRNNKQETASETKFDDLEIDAADQSERNPSCSKMLQVLVVIIF